MVTAWSIRDITRSILPILVILTLLEILGSGIVLDSFADTLLTNPSILVLVPVMIGTAGNLGSILASRTSTAFHLGTLSFHPDDPILRGGALSTLALAVTVFPLVGTAAWVLTGLVSTQELPLVTVVLVATTSGIVLAILAILVTLVATYAAYRFQLDPDNVVIPIVTNVCDVLGVIVLLGVVLLLV